MKLIIAIVQGIVLAVICWMISGTTLEKLRSLADLEPNFLAQKYLQENIKDSGQRRPQYSSMQEAELAAEKDIQAGKNIAATNGLTLGLYRIGMAVAFSVIGFAAYFIALLPFLLFSKIIPNGESTAGIIVLKIMWPMGLVTFIGYSIMGVTCDLILRNIIL